MSLKFGILTVSDTCSADSSKDASGPEAERLVHDVTTEAGAILRGQIIRKGCVPDDMIDIKKTLIDWSEIKDLDVILTLGGTGLSERDVTPEATKEVIEKDVPGISMAMFNSSFKVTQMAMLSRAVCGIRGKTLIINLPGSPKAVNECLTAIAKVIPHAVALIRDNKSKIVEDHKIIQNSNILKEISSKYENLQMTLSDVANRLRVSPYPMVSMDEAKQIIRSVADNPRLIFGDNPRIVSMINKELVSVENAYGRILATEVFSNVDLPPFRASIKDGYAVIATDGKGSRRVLGGVEAGHEPGSFKLISGSCVRINTGAPVPDDATAVVQVEDTTRLQVGLEKEELLIDILVAPTEGQDIRPVGSDIQKGSSILKVKTKIGAVEMGLLAACGVTKIQINKLPTVGILSTGNELQSPGEAPKSGHVYDSNKITLMATIKESGYNPVDLGIVGDDLKTMITVIERALDRVDVLITTGSVSMGDKDMLKPILTEIFGAKIHFGRVNLKPGKPTTFASCYYHDKHKYFLCLPGNPVSAMVTAHLFAIPVLHRLAGNWSEPTVAIARLTADYKLDSRPEYARAILTWEANDSTPKVYSTGNQISSKLLSCKTANALLMLPEKTQEKETLKSGECVSAMLLGFDTNPRLVFQKWRSGNL